MLSVCLFQIKTQYFNLDEMGLLLFNRPIVLSGSLFQAMPQYFITQLNILPV